MWKLFSFVVVIAYGVILADGLKCYQCFDANPDGSCVHDYKGLTSAAQGNFENGSMRYYKDCGENNTLNYCLIEEFYVTGVMRSFIRDCSDGSNFSFTGEPEGDNVKLSQITDDNYTTCVFVKNNVHICLTLCPTDFCNGPIPPANETCNETGDNSTCGAGQLFAYHGPFGPIVDRVLGRGYFLPLLVAIFCAMLF